MRTFALVALFVTGPLAAVPAQAAPCRPMKGKSVVHLKADATVSDWSQMLEGVTCKTINVPEALAEVVLGAALPKGAVTASVLWNAFGKALKGEGLKLAGAGMKWQVRGAAPAGRKVSKAQLEKVLKDPSKLSGEVEVSWVVGEGGIGIGYELVRVAPGGFIARLGLRPGDVLTEANGRALDTPSNALGAVKALSSSPRVELTLLRAGSAHTLTYLVVSP